MPRLLDLFCGAGGAALGYYRAGFEVVGVDIVPQPRYPFEFHLADALECWLGGFDAVHASPPCQKFSRMSHSNPGVSAAYPDLIGAIRIRLRGIPYVIENVPGAPLHDPVVLCGQMFGLDLYRHRLFETSFDLTPPTHPAHVRTGSKAGHGPQDGGWEPGRIISVAGHCAPIAECRRAMGIDWMRREELAEAIPPAYTEFVGRQLFLAVQSNGRWERERAGFASHNAPERIRMEAGIDGANCQPRLPGAPSLE